MTEEQKPIEGEVIEAEEYRVGKKPKFSLKMCSDLIESASKGLTKSQFCVKFNITPRAWEYWKHEHEDWKEAVELADHARDAFAHRQLEGTMYKQVEVNEKLFLRYIDRLSLPEHRTSQPSRSPVQVINNIDTQGSLGSSNPEERMKRLEELKQKLLEEIKSDSK
jgi:hypothetical protein